MGACDRSLSDLDIQGRHMRIRVDLQWGRPELISGQIEEVDIRQKDDLVEEERYVQTTIIRPKLAAPTPPSSRSRPADKGQQRRIVPPATAEARIR